MIMIIIGMLQSCIIMINENSFRALKYSDKDYFQPFNIDMVNKKVNNKDSLVVYEINSKNIKESASKNKYTWVHLWRPYCPSDFCQNINYFSDIADKKQGLSLLLISETYSVETIRSCVVKSDYNRSIFVLQDSYYGHKTRENRLKLYNDFKIDSLVSTKGNFDDYLFKDTVLIFAGNLLNEHIIDSLMIAKSR